MKVEHRKYNPLISVIVPIYNIQEYLRQCIESIIKQTYENIEIILVNDGSTDNCGKVCNEYAAKDTRIKVLHKENGGLVSARKAGLEQSTGDYIACVDGDDWIEKNMYSKMVEIALEHDVDIVVAGHKEELCGEVVEIGVNKLPNGFYSKEDLENKVYPVMLCTENFSEFGIYSYLWNKLFKKEAIFSFQMATKNDVSIGEDATVVYPALLNANSIYISDDASYHYRQHVNSMVKTLCSNILDLEKFNSLYFYLHEVFERYKLNNMLIEQLNKFILSLLTVRAGINYLEELKSYYPFDVKDGESRIVIYGAGTFGQHLYTNLNQSKKYHVVRWVDNNSRLYRLMRMPVDNIDKIKEVNFDALIIAYINSKTAFGIRDDLISKGIERDKILLVKILYKTDIESILINFGVKLK